MHKERDIVRLTKQERDLAVQQLNRAIHAISIAGRCPATAPAAVQAIAEA